MHLQQQQQQQQEKPLLVHENNHWLQMQHGSACAPFCSFSNEGTVGRYTSPEECYYYMKACLLQS
jgi:hypothetical protein